MYNYLLGIENLLSRRKGKSNMSQYRDQLGALGYSVNQGIQVYAGVHKYIEQEGASAKSAFKNLFGKGVPMSQLLEAAEGLVPIWVDIQSKLFSFESQTFMLLDSDEQRYLDLMNEYVKKVRVAIDALVRRQRLLAEPPVKWSSHQAASQEYQSAMAAFIEAEERMNQASLWG